MSLPSSDASYLAERGIEHHVSVEANMTCVLLPKFQLPPGLNLPEADLLLRLNAGYPDVPPDMWWFDPPITRVDGNPIEQTQVMEVHLGRTWQRWSRHLDPAQWRTGVDGLESFLALIRGNLRRYSALAA